MFGTRLVVEQTVIASGTRCALETFPPAPDDAGKHVELLGRTLEGDHQGDLGRSELQLRFLASRPAARAHENAPASMSACS